STPDGEKIADDAAEIGCALDLRPVPARTKDVKLDVGERAKKREARIEGDDAIVTPMHEERRRAHLAEPRLERCKVVDAALSRRRKHARERLLNARPNARPIPEVDEVVARERAIVREELDEAPHVLDARGVPPHGIEP